MNSGYLWAPETEFVYDILTSMNQTNNGYCLILKEKQVLDPIFHEFSVQLRKKFMGNLILAESDTSKPFLFKPTLFLNVNIRKSKEEDLTFLGERILENLKEVSLFLPRIVLGWLFQLPRLF